ncbi:aspartyl-phosphate phosphatase Spo0E family protein [Halalkalibacter lacteus]|uniref:aspartyl-phosphate phosphatase Spo0E family protein n=1 Tax=Halalkalibacter lacteus TaxID=3090663 RepID=UPI002FC60DE3
MNKNKLIESITVKKDEMGNIALKYGLGSERTLKCSQELDNLLNAYQQSFY